MSREEESWQTAATMKFKRPQETAINKNNINNDNANHNDTSNSNIQERHAYDSTELFSDSPAAVSSLRSKRQIPCRYFLQGFCAAGTACAFLHTATTNKGEERKGPGCVDNNNDNSKYNSTRGQSSTSAPIKEDIPNFSSMDITDRLCKFALKEQNSGTNLESDPLNFGAISFAKSASLGLQVPSYPSSSSSNLHLSPATDMNDQRMQAVPFLPASAFCSSPTSSFSLLSASTPVTPTTTILFSNMSKSDELCAFAMVGKCRYGNMCRNTHGLQCPRCLRYCLHPHVLDRNEEHIEECLGREEIPCETNEMNSIECGICLEKVAQKEDPRFGLMSCDHAFCLDCIRIWRSKHSMSDLATKSCPLCRATTFFVIPSSTWTTDRIEKERIVESFKKKVGAINCKYFNHGDGECPFGTSCFYAHRTRDGIPDRPIIRAYIGKDEKLRMVRETKLSDFIDFQQNRQTAATTTNSLNKQTPSPPPTVNKK